MGAFFVINMVVGCVIDNFDEVRQTESGALLMTQEQGEWVEAARVVSPSSLPKSSPLLLRALDAVTDGWCSTC